MRTQILSLVMSVMFGACAPTLAPTSSVPAPASPVPTAPQPSAVVDRTLVFVLTTGLEDAQTMSSVFKHARTAAEQHRLREVVVLVYGRGVFAFDGGISSRPPKIADMIRQAMAAGVRVQVCANALQHMGIDPTRLDPQPTEIVPSAMVTLVDYVARGAAVVRY